MLKIAALNIEDEKKARLLRAFNRKVDKSFNLSIKETENRLTELKKFDIDDDIYSESNASEYREEELLVGMDNVIS